MPPPHPLARPLSLVRVDAVDRIVPRAGRQVTGQRFQQRRLARAVAPDHGHAAAGRHLDGHAEQDLAAAVTGAQSLTGGRKGTSDTGGVDLLDLEANAKMVFDNRP